MPNPYPRAAAREGNYSGRVQIADMAARASARGALLRICGKPVSSITCIAILLLPPSGERQQVIEIPELSASGQRQQFVVASNRPGPIHSWTRIAPE